MSNLTGEVLNFELIDEDVPQGSGNYERDQDDDIVVDRDPWWSNEQQQAKIQECFEITEENINAEQTKLKIEDFVFTKVLGQGKFGKIFLVRKIAGRDSNKHFAMKVIKKGPLCGEPKDTEHTHTERNILATVKHPFIVELKYAFQTKVKLYLIMEYMSGGDLFTLFNRQIQLSEADARFVSSEIILALGHLHGLGIIYRDLKPENVLLDAEGHVKLTDFGLSKECMQEGKVTYTFCGSVTYIAPEVLKGKGHGKDVDWWALGAIIYEMITGRQAFTGSCREDTARNIFKRNLKFPMFFKKEARDLVRCLLKRLESERLGSGPDDAIAVQSHAFFKDTNWDDVLARRVKSPFKPLLRGDNDVSQFDKEFTKQIPVESPTNSSLAVDFHFEGFSYEEPSTLDETRTNNLQITQSPPRRNTTKSWINILKSCF